MDPNSKNQLWSFWQYRIYPDFTKKPNFSTVKTNVARFGRLVFGSASEMRLIARTDDKARLYWEITVRSEGHPVHDPQYTEWMHAQWRKFLFNGFGPKSEIYCHARLEAGDRQDGAPADQLIIMPPLIEGEEDGKRSIQHL